MCVWGGRRWRSAIRSKRYKGPMQRYTDKEPATWRPTHTETRSDARTRRSTQRQGDTDRGTATQIWGHRASPKAHMWKKAFVSRVSARPISRTVIERHTEIDGETHRHARNERVIGDVYRQIARPTESERHHYGQTASQMEGQTDR